jgi:hypothetical protein
MRGSANDWYVIPIFVVIAAASVAARYWKIFVQWIDGVRGRDWATAPAVVDIVTVVSQTQQGRGGEIVVGYLATLTYSYHNPDLQMGEYCRTFDPDDEEDAQAWAASYKGSTVMVHVDPHDVSRSVLRKEDL